MQSLAEMEEQSRHPQGVFDFMRELPVEDLKRAHV
jgi:hypothetical protein